MPKTRRKREPVKPLDHNSYCSMCFGDGPFTTMEHPERTISLGFNVLPGKHKVPMSRNKKSRVLTFLRTEPAREIPMKARVCASCKPRAKKDGWRAVK